MVFVIFYLRKITKRVEKATLRINSAFSYMIKKSLNSENKEDNNYSIDIIEN